MDRDYDLIVIGGGAAGLAAAQAGAAARARTLLVADGEIGGECTFTGCVPSKALIEAAARGAAFPEAAASVRKAVAAIAATETADVLTRRGIEVLRSHAAFRSPREITVDGRGLRARGFVVATGSRPVIPPVTGLAGLPYLTNENVFELTDLPASLAVLGGGAVGCELAQAFARLGSQVTLIEAAPRLLSAADPAAAAVISEVFAAEGITVRTGSPVETVTTVPNGSGCLLQLHDSAQVTAEQLLVAAGRTPSTADLGLTDAGIRLNDCGTPAVDATLATTVRGIYAAGDVTGLMPFTHAAYAMGRIAARNALRKHRPPERFSPKGIPWAMFTDPEVAQAGLTEEQAAAQVPGARVAYLPMRDVDRAVTAGRTEGFIKIIAGPRRLAGSLGGGRVLGATIVALRAGEMIGEIALAMRTGMFTAGSPRPPTSTRHGHWPSSRQRPSSSAATANESPAPHRQADSSRDRRHAGNHGQLRDARCGRPSSPQGRHGRGAVHGEVGRDQRGDERPRGGAQRPDPAARPRQPRGRGEAGHDPADLRQHAGGPPGSRTRGRR